MHKIVRCFVFLCLLAEAGMLLAQQPVITPSTSRVTRDGKPYFEHTVEKGHTLYGISKAYQVTMEDIVLSNPGADQGLSIGQKILIPAGQATSEAGEKVQDQVDTRNTIFHVVRKGETLYAISRIYEVSVESITAANPGSEKGLTEGTRLRIPLPEVPVAAKTPTFIVHEIRKDENLQDVAAKYGIKVDDILKYNEGLDQGIGRLKRGTQLRIPQFGQLSGTDVTEKAKEGESETWTERRKDKSKPCERAVSKSNRYKIALLLPLYSRMVDGIQTDPVVAVGHEEHPSFRFIQFYEGALMALDSLRAEGMNAEFFVYDIDEDTLNSLRLIRDKSLQDMDLIIGPLFSAPFSIISDYAAHHGIPVINPLSQRDEIVEGNPWVFKLIPSSVDRMKAVSTFALEQYSNPRLIVLHRQVEREIRVADSFITVLNETLPRFERDTGDYKLLSGSYVSTAKLREVLHPDRMNVLYTLSSDQVYVLNFLRNISIIAKDYPLIIFGLPSWPEFTGMEADYLVNLNIHMYANTWVDYQRPEVHTFVGGFRTRFGAEPDQYAFMGFDITRYFMSALLQYGKNFIPCLNEMKMNGFQSAYQFSQRPGDGFINHHTHIYRYQDFKETDARQWPVGINR